MDEQIIEVEADSLEEAREQIRLQIREGLALCLEKIVSDGRPINKVKSVIDVEADSLEAARAQVNSQIPGELVLLSEKIVSDGTPIIKAKRVIDVEADSLEEARERVKSQVSEGLQLLSEQVISDGSPKTVKALADTTEAAFAMAKSEIPATAEILEKKELSAPKLKVTTVEAFDEEQADLSAKIYGNQRFGTSMVKSLKLVTKGRKGFLGIGKNPNQYEAELLKQSTVEVTYKPKIKISAEIGEVYKPKAKISAEIGEVFKPKVKISAKMVSAKIDKDTTKCMICHAKMSFKRKIGGGIMFGDELLEVILHTAYKCLNCGAPICQACASTPDTVTYCLRCGRNVFQVDFERLR